MLSYATTSLLNIFKKWTLTVTFLNHLNNAPMCPFKSVERKKRFWCLIHQMYHLEQI